MRGPSRWRTFRVSTDFAGAPCYADITITVDERFREVCFCTSSRGNLVTVEILAVWAKDQRTPCGYHTTRAVINAIKRDYRHRGHVCYDCLMQPPFMPP